MTTIRDYPIRAVGLPWVRKEDYAALLKVCEDSDGLPATWEKFVELSEKAEKRFQADGLIVERVYLDPDTFPDWCQKHGLGVNSEGRIKFAAWVTGQIHRNQS